MAFGILLLGNARTAAPDESVALRWFSDATTAEAGRTRVIAFAADVPAAAVLRPVCSVADPAVLEVVRPPELLAGASIGWLRVRGLAVGETALHLGGSVLRVSVVPPRSPLDPDQGRPAIVQPAAGAAVWGEFAVGVEVDDPEFGPARSIELRLSTGQRIVPRQDGHPSRGPTRRCVFHVDAGALPEGRLELVAVSLGGDGSAQPSEPVAVRVMHPDRLICFEAEDPGDVERPERWGRERPLVLVDPAASGAEFALNNGARPAVCIPVKMEGAGRWQMMLRARGSFAGGALPTVGLYIDKADQPATNGCLVEEDWHRIALGIPVALGEGEHLLVPFYMNDFAAGGLADRNLHLDRIELACVDESASPGTPGTVGAMDAMAMDMMADQGRRGGVRVAFQTALDGRAVPGLIEVRGTCSWEDRDHTPPPRVTLFVNGKPLGTQRSAAPRFLVDAAAFVAGENTVQLAAESERGATGATPVQRVVRTARSDSEPGAPRSFHRFSVHEAGWEEDAAKRMAPRPDAPERKVLPFSSNGRGALRLPEELAGSFDVYVEARGEDFDGPAIVTAWLDGVKLGEAPAYGGWALVRIATATLARGPKSLAVGFENDKYEKGKGDRNLFVEAVALLESCGPDAVAPWARIAWPPAGHPVHLVDAVIADAGDDRELAWGELVIDGKPTGVRADLARRPGRMVFPLLARELAAGEHTLAVRVRDAAGNGFATPPAAMSVLAEAPAELGPYARAVHLLNRFAYGPEPDELAAVLTMGEQAWLADRLSRTLVDAGEEAALEQAVAQFANGRGPNEVQSRAVLHALASPNPVRVRAVQWIENHFSTWIRKTGAELEWPEHVEFLRLGPRTFADLVLASARSPSMLRYLDAPQSVARRLNENYAREIMELHTLGVHGGYTQADVTALASLLTGWGFAEEGDGHSGGPVGRRTFRFDPQLNDGSPRLALGLAFPKAAPVERYDRARMAIELLCAHPSHARFVCRKLAEHYVAVPAPDDLVEDLARVYVTRYGDLEEVLLAISRHPAFWAAPVRMTSPFDFAMRLSRTSGAQQPGAVMEFLQRSGMGVFDRATPDGYPEEDRGWANSNALLQRWRLARRSEGALAGFVPGPWRGGAEPPDDRWRQAVLDAIAVRLTGNLLGENSNRAALDLLAATRGDRREVVRAAAAFVAQLPEANVR